MTRKDKRNKIDVDGGRWLPMPFAVIDSIAFKRLSPHAVKLLLDFAAQLNSNNGMLVCCWKYLKLRGWRSETMAQKAKRELLDAGFIWETRKGARPNKAAWYAVTWAPLVPNDGYDQGADGAVRAFKYARGQYRLLDVQASAAKKYDQARKVANL